MAHVRSFTKANFTTDVLKAELPVLVDFTASWCSPCKAISKAIEALADAYQGKALVGKVDIDDDAVLAARYKVKGVPTLILFVKGKPVSRLVGAQPKKDIEAVLKKGIE